MSCCLGVQKRHRILLLVEGAARLLYIENAAPGGAHAHNCIITLLHGEQVMSEGLCRTSERMQHTAHTFTDRHIVATSKQMICKKPPQHTPSNLTAEPTRTPRAQPRCNFDLLININRDQNVSSRGRLSTLFE